MTRWPRYSEAFLALWLVVSGWVVDYPDLTQYRVVSVSAGLAILTLDLLSIALWQRYAYLLVMPVAMLLIAFSFGIAPAEAQGTQNLIMVALLLLMFAVLPTEATLPPPPWRKTRQH